METTDIVLLAVTLVILAEVSFLLAKLPKTTMKTKDRAILIDTSVLMDGRIVRVAETGFMGGTLVVPRSVIGELQFLADHADADKRARARFGLDVVSELQKMENVDVELLQDGSKAEEGVDERLLTLAKRHNAVVCTLDFNLNKVAVVEGIKVLNINELAQSLRMQHLPGEQMEVEVTQKGQDAHQGVGYMSDGTMVVVEQGHKVMGQRVRVEVVRSLQTAAGKMMFARTIEQKSAPKPTKKQDVAAKVEQRPAAKKPAGRAPRQPREQVESKQQPKAQPRAQQKDAPVQQHRNSKTAATPAKQPTRTQAQQKPAQKTVAARRPQQRRRVDHEDALIKLVDSQE